MATKPKSQQKREEVQANANPSEPGVTRTENGQEVSKMGVAVFEPGQHPKDRQLAAKRLLDAQGAPVEVAPEGHESVVDQMPRSTRKTPLEAAAEGKKIQGELEAAKKLDSGELEKEQQEKEEAAQKAHDEEVEKAKKEVEAKK